MLRTTRISVILLVAAACLSAAACSGSNDSPTSAGASGSATTITAGMASTPTAGTASTPTAGTGSVGVAGTASATTAGSSSGGSSPDGTAGTVGGGGDFMPLCAGLTTAAGMAPTKAGACTDADPQLCYKTCGPQSSGFKSETCSGGAYAEQSGCTFPDTLDATCFKLPDTQDATCPTTPPQASSECTVAACTPCNGGGGPTGTYLDSKGASKIGYCVCPAPGASGTSKWSCGSSDAWPCPGAKGC